jgi:hypothetical protein
VDTQETTPSTSFTNLTTPGPAVTVTTGTQAIVAVYARLANNTAGAANYMSWEVSGASAISPTANKSYMYESGAANDQIHSCAIFLQTGLTAGSNVFTAKYQVSAGTGTFEHRRIMVVPL